MVVALGADVHKRTHTVVAVDAVDAVGAKRGERVVPATDAGHDALLRWARRTFGDGDRVWAVEDCRHLSRAAGTRPAGSRRADRAGAAEADGARRGAGAHLRQVRSDRRAGGRPGGAAGAGSAGGPLDGPPRDRLLVDHRETWSLSGPARSTGCAGTCTNSTPG